MSLLYATLRPKFRITVSLLCLWLVAAVSMICATAANPSRREQLESVGARRYSAIEYCRINDKPLLLDLYLPSESESRFIPVLCIHGGSWVDGNRTQIPVVSLIRAGYAVVSIDFRSAAEAVFPAQFEDCKSAVQWIHSNADDWKLDSSRIGVWGHSSGGQLAALLGTAGGEAPFGISCGKPEVSCRVQAVCVKSGPLDLLSWNEDLESGGFNAWVESPKSPVTRLLGARVSQNPDLARRASPSNYISADDPPFFLVQGSKDFSVPLAQAQRFANALSLLGVKVELEIFPLGHAIDGNEYEDRMIKFFDENLRSSAL